MFQIRCSLFLHICANWASFRGLNVSKSETKNWDRTSENTVRRWNSHSTPQLYSLFFCSSTEGRFTVNVFHYYFIIMELVYCSVSTLHRSYVYEVKGQLRAHDSVFMSSAVFISLTSFYLMTFFCVKWDFVHLLVPVL